MAVITIVALLLAAEITRLTVAERFADEDPQLAVRLAPNSPFALVSIAMAEVGEAAARDSDPSVVTLHRLQTLARVAPLRPEPFLVEGALAEKQGDITRAEALFKEAELRDPRSTAARYLLADVWLREGKTVDSLKEMAVLARLLPGASLQLVPALAQYAQSPGAAKELRPILDGNPGLKPPLLMALSADPANAQLILYLAGADIGSAAPETRRWQARLLQGFVQRGEYQRAYDLWHRVVGVPMNQSPPLFNPRFTNNPAPPPFNWSYNSGNTGVAEPADGKLRVLYYGRVDTVLASQLLLLRPGRYRFEATANGHAVEGALKWNLTCDTTGKQIMELEIGRNKRVPFTVPQDCEAQRLDLDGRSQDAPEVTDVQIGPLTLERTGA